MTDISDGLRAARDVLARGAHAHFGALRDLLSEAAADPKVGADQQREASALVLELHAAAGRGGSSLS